MPSARISHRPSFGPSSNAGRVIPSSFTGGFATSAVRDLLTVGDSESPIASNTSSPVMPLFADIIAQMFAGTFTWSDLCEDDNTVFIPTVVSRTVSTKSDFKSAFPGLQETIADIYDTSPLSDDQFRTVMEWLCQNGWDILDYNRHTVSAYPASFASTNWVDIHGLLTPTPEEEHRPKKVVALSAPGTDEGRRVAAPVPRFCREAHACQKRGCAYVHGNTIPRLNESCRFGEGCGSSDPTGVKRSQCLRMHPGEHYHPEMVVTRRV